MERITKGKDFKKPHDDDMINSDDEPFEQKSFQIIREENNPSTEMISEIMNNKINYFEQEESSEESNNNNVYFIYNNIIEQIEKKEQLSLNKTIIAEKDKMNDAANDDLKGVNFLNKKKKLSRESYIFNKEIPTKKKKVTKIEIENSTTEEKNKDNNLKSEIFKILLEIFRKKEFDKKFMDNLKKNSWNYYLDNQITIELEENLEKDKEFFELLKESPWRTFERIFKRAKDVDQDFKYKIGKRTIVKFAQLINFFLNQKEKKNDGTVSNGKNYLINNNEKSNDMLELNDIILLEQNNPNSFKRTKYKTIPKKNRKDNLFYVLKNKVVDLFLKYFNNISQKVKKSIKAPCSSSEEIDFLNTDSTEIFRYFKLKKHVENKKIEDLIKLPKREFFRRMINDGKFFTEDEEKQRRNYENSKCRNLANELFETNNLEGLILLTKLIKLDKQKDKKGNDKEYIKILNAKNFKKAINILKGYEDFNLDLFNNEKYEINNRINNMWIIANDPIKYLENRKKGRKNIRKIG